MKVRNCQHADDSFKQIIFQKVSILSDQSLTVETVWKRESRSTGEWNPV